MAANTAGLVLGAKGPAGAGSSAAGDTLAALMEGWTDGGRDSPPVISPSLPGQLSAAEVDAILREQQGKQLQGQQLQGEQHLSKQQPARAAVCPALSRSAS